MTESSTSAHSLPAEYYAILQQLLSRDELPPPRIESIMSGLMDGVLGEIESAALLTAWRAKGETASELAGAARVLRKAMIPLDGGDTELIDTCGTGGDGTRTFNISTAAALVVAGTGARVAKHGNRAVTSRSGAGDLLNALGVKLQPGPEWPRQTLRETGLAFCFAPEFHPALARLAGLRKRLGFRTIFNCLGPLANPAGASYQVVGVGSAELLESMSGALAQLSSRHSFVVAGADGLDEVTLTGPTYVREIVAGHVQPLVWHPADFGLPACSLRDLTAAGPEQSAAIVRGVLRGEPGPCRDIVLANAAAALLAIGKVRDLRSGVSIALEAIQTGRAGRVLERLKMA
jgi:anthranilate phosphoribosyltransferase